MEINEIREGEIVLPQDPADFADDANVVFIGKICTDWETRGECPKNLVQARERGNSARIEVDSLWRRGLSGLENASHLIVLYWMHEARRDLIMQTPRHKSQPIGTFALRSPVRPNPIALAIVKIIAVDQQTGVIEIDAIDCLNGTPLVDIKPWIASIDGVVE
jgi:tRNA-Thr(GGU) m(6)t(6)A37 methyltransferase TsaA